MLFPLLFSRGGLLFCCSLSRLSLCCSLYCLLRSLALCCLSLRRFASCLSLLSWHRYHLLSQMQDSILNEAWLLHQSHLCDELFSLQ